MVAPLVENKSAPISSVTSIVNPVGTKNVAGAQVNPATEDTLTLARVAAEAINTALQAGGISQVQLAAIVTALGTRATEATLASILAKFVPLDKGIMHVVAKAIGADFFGAALAPTNTPCLFRIMVLVSIAGVVSVNLIKGGVTVAMALNSGVALAAGCAYTFDVLIHSGDTFNMQTSVASNVTCRVQEIVGGVQ